MRLVQFLLLVCIATSYASYHLSAAAQKKHIRSAVESPDSSPETPDSSPETPNSETDTPETPDTPDSTPGTPDTPETPDSKAVVPNSSDSHINEIDVDDGISGSGHNDSIGNGHDNNPVLGKKTRNLKKQHSKIEEAAKKSSKPKTAKQVGFKGTKKQLLGYPEPDGKEGTAFGDFGQGGPPEPGYGGLGRGGLGSEIEGMAVGMGGGGEPLGFREEDGLSSPNFHVPGIAGPSNYDENSEVGRGNDEDDGLLNRFGEKEDADSLTQHAISRYDGYDDSESPLNGENLQQIEPDEAVTKAIGRPFDPQSDPNGMDEHEDSPFQNVKQENPFQVPLHTIADQASFAESQMQKFRPESGPPLGPQQEETPFQPQGGEEPEEQGYGGQEGENIQATTMNGAEAMMGMGMSEQGGMKRHKTNLGTRKTLPKMIKRKGISKKNHHKKNYS